MFYDRSYVVDVNALHHAAQFAALMRLRFFFKDGMQYTTFRMKKQIESLKPGGVAHALACVKLPDTS